MLADVLSQINGRKHATTQVAPNLAYSDPEMAEIALRNIGRRAKHKVTRPEIKVGDMVRIRVKPIESRGSYRVNKIAWSEKVYRVVSAKSGEMGARFGLEGWPEKVVHRDLRKVPENSAPEPRGLEVAIPPAEATERPQAPTSFLTVPLRLYNVSYNVSDSSACHSLMSSFTSVRGLLGEPSMSLSNQRRASSARWPGCEEPCRSRTPLPRLPASARHSRACTQGVGLPRACRPAAYRGARCGGAGASAVGFSRSHACMQRKAAEEVILSSCGGSSVRPPTKISVLFLEDLDAALQLLTAPSLTVGLLLKQSSMLPHHLQLR